MSFYDADTPLAVVGSLVWPILLLIAILYGLGHCVRLLLTKIIKTINSKKYASENRLLHK